MKSKIGLIVAMDKNNGIGFRNTLPWRLPGDLGHFRKLSMGNAVIMGRNTWESLPDALAGRVNIVVTNRAIINPPADTYTCPDLETAIEFAKKFEREYIYLIGGKSIYDKAMPLIEVAHVTQVFLDNYIDVSADTLVFPEHEWDYTVESCPLRINEATKQLLTPTHQYLTFTRKQEVKE